VLPVLLLQVTQQIRVPDFPFDMGVNNGVFLHELFLVRSFHVLDLLLERSNLIRSISMDFAYVSCNLLKFLSRLNHDFTVFFPLRLLHHVKNALQSLQERGLRGLRHAERDSIASRLGGM
jgi:hypothetical protein